MLNVTILKVAHVGDEARKIRTHIEACDVFCPEAAGMPKEGAVSEEKTWARAIASSLSRSNFLSQIDRATEHFSPEHRTFYRQSWDYLFRGKKPVYFLERWEEAPDFTPSIPSSKDALSPKTLYDFIKRTAEGSKMRDQHMAANLALLEPHVKTLYPKLACKEALNVAICLGATHRLENVLSVPPVIVDLDGNPLLYEEGDDLRHEAFARIMGGETFEQMEGLMEKLYRVPVKRN